MTHKLPYQSLHCHTTTSDGSLTYQQVLDACKKNNIGVIAFTDHDSLPTSVQIDQLKKINHEVKCVTGIELSATNIKEVTSNIELFHIVGLFIDPFNKDLIAHCATSKEKRIARTKQIINNCHQIGFDLTYDAVKQFVTGAVVGRPHIAKAILAKEHNINLIMQFETMLQNDAQVNPNLRAMYTKVKTGDLWQKIFTLFLSDDSYIKGIYIHYIDALDMDQAVALIRNAGGIAILAHWSYYSDRLSLTLVEKICKERRIDGIETVYAFGTPLNEMPHFTKDMDLLSDLCIRYHLAQSGGGDFHTLDDFSLMVNKQFITLSEKTQNLVDRIFEIYPQLKDK